MQLLFGLIKSWKTNSGAGDRQEIGRTSVEREELREESERWGNHYHDVGCPSVYVLLLLVDK